VACVEQANLCPEQSIKTKKKALSSWRLISMERMIGFVTKQKF
jgi:hypothetical protein